MKRISTTRRLALGLGIIATGLCAALPFRLTPSSETVAVTSVSDEPLTLGEGVPLQVPGQTVSPELPARALRPWPVDGESDEPGPASLSQEPEAPKTVPPPALPDRYRPLFMPLPSTGFATEGGIHASQEATVVSRPLKQHTIHDGDTLESLALRYLGDAGRASEILTANRDVLSDPALLPIGVKILIPRLADDAVPDRSASAATSETPRLVPLPTESYRRGF